MIKKFLLNQKWFVKILGDWLNLKIRIAYYLPKKVAHQMIYKRFHNGKRMNIVNPSTYDEIIHYHMIHTYDKDYSKYADKYEVRNFVKECGFEDCLVPVYKVYDKVEEINWDELPNKFVLMLSHASGGNYYTICSDKSKIDVEKEKRKLSEGMKKNFARELLEYHYSYIKPRILCEKYLENEGQERLNDYKIVCSYGQPIAILVCSDRDEGRDYFSPEWEYLDYTHKEKRSSAVIEKPTELQEMLDKAAILSRNFPISRIDFYIVDHKVYFSEITLTPSSGNNIMTVSDKGLYEIGAKIKSICDEHDKKI